MALRLATYVVSKKVSSIYYVTLLICQRFPSISKAFIVMVMCGVVLEAN